MNHGQGNHFSLLDYLSHLNLFKEEATPSTLDFTWITLHQVIKHIMDLMKTIVHEHKNAQ